MEESKFNLDEEEENKEDYLDQNLSDDYQRF